MTNQEMFKEQVQMKTTKECHEQLVDAYEYMQDILDRIPPGTGAYSRQQGYIDALEWVLNDTETEEAGILQRIKTPVMVICFLLMGVTGMLLGIVIFMVLLEVLALAMGGV